MIPPSKPSDAPFRPELTGSAPNGEVLRAPDLPGQTGAALSRAVAGASGAHRPDGAAGTHGPDTAAGAHGVPLDLIRRIAVSTAAASAAVIAALLASADGAFVDRSSGALLGSSASLLAPAAPLWWMWLPVMAAWLGYALYQWLPRQRQNQRQERFGWLVLGSQVLAFAWLLAVSAGNAGILLTVAAAQIAVGLVAVHSMNLHPPSFRLEGILADAPLRVSLAAGVMSLVAVLALILTEAEADVAGWGGTVWAVVGLITVTVGTNLVCMTDRGHLSLALAVVWGLSCIAFERLTAAPDSISIGAAAAVAAFLVLVSAGSRRHQVDHERRRSERQTETRRHRGSAPHGPIDSIQHGSIHPDSGHTDSVQPANA